MNAYGRWMWCKYCEPPRNVCPEVIHEGCRDGVYEQAVCPNCGAGLYPPCRIEVTAAALAGAAAADKVLDELPEIEEIVRKSARR